MSGRLSLLAIPLLALACAPPSAVVEPEPEPEPAPAAPPSAAEPRFVDVFVTWNYGCAVERTGLIWCWGDDPATHAGLREASATWTEARELPDVGPARAIVGSRVTTCALLDDGQVRCWQSKLHPKQTSYELEHVPGISDAVDIEFNAGELCVRTEVGDVWCSTIEGLDRRQVASGIVDFAINDERSCGLDERGQVWCWGDFAQSISSMERELGLALTRGEHGEVLMAILPGAVEIEVGEARGDALVRLASGEILLEPPTEPEAVPLREYLHLAGLESAVDLDFGEGHGCVATKTGEVRCWGGNGLLQLATGDSRTHAEVVTIPGLTDIDRVEASRSLSCAMRSGVGDQPPGLWCWGLRSPTGAEVMAEGGHTVLTDARSVVVHANQACATTNAGENLCWGVRTQEGLEIDAQGIFAAATPTPLPIELGPLAIINEDCYVDEAGEMRCGYMLHASDPDQSQCTITTDFELAHEASKVTDYVHAGLPCVLSDGAIACADQETGDQAPTPKLRKIRDIAAGDEYICAIHGNRARISCFHVDIVEEGDDPLAPLDSSALIHIPHVTGARVLIDVRVRDCFVFLDADGVANTFCLDGRGGDHELIGPNPWPVLPPGDDLVAFGGDMCVLGRDRTISCAGPRDDVARVLPYTDVEAIDAYGTTLCLIQDGGALTCTGPNSVGQLGTPPLKQMLTEPTAITFGPA